MDCCSTGGWLAGRKEHGEWLLATAVMTLR